MSDLKPIKVQLYILAIARGTVFWYAIEKLFELQINITLPQIVIIGIIAQASKAIFEIPTSIVADRWSRRNILLAANVFMIICSIILGTSSTMIIYIIGTLFWSLSDALSSGVYR